MKQILKKWLGEVKDGVCHLDDKEGFACTLLLLEGKRVELTVGKVKNRRSNNQNDYYWGVVVEILADYWGYLPMEAHEAIKWELLRREDGPVPTVRSTADLNTAEFEIFLDRARIWALTEFEVKIPLPNEITF